MTGQADSRENDAAARIPLHWLQALRGQSVLFTRAEALEIIGARWGDVLPGPATAAARARRREFERG